MIFDHDGQPLVRRVVRRPLGHRPGPKHAVHLEPEIEVEAPGSVLVDHEQPALLFRRGRGREPAGSGVRSSERLAR